MDERVLVLSGTGWLGGAVARAWRDRGAAVTVLARGTSADPTADDRFAGIAFVPGDRDTLTGLDRLPAGHWDAVVDVTSIPGRAARAAAAIGERAAHWTVVSSASVYADQSAPHGTESSALLDADAGIDTGADFQIERYGAAKVAVERATAEVLGDRALIARPGLIVGPGDPSDRFGYWVGRFALAGAEPVLVPDTSDRWHQWIDVRDLAAWIVESGAVGRAGVVDTIGRPVPLGGVLDAATRTAGFVGALTPADDVQLARAGVAPWAGPRSLPLWLPRGGFDGFQRRSVARFLATGPVLRPLDATLADVLDDERARGLDRPRTAGLSREDELDVIRALG